MGFLSGDTEPVLARLEAEMHAAAEALQFERAARLRDRIGAVHKAAETQQMVSERAEDFDVVGLAEDPLEASVQIFRVRRGRVVGHRGFVAEKVEDLSGPEFMATVVTQVYGSDSAEVPRRVLVPEEPTDREVLESWMRVRARRSGGDRRPAPGCETLTGRDGGTHRFGGPGPPPPAPGIGSQCPLESLDRIAGGAFAPGCAPAH